jgi:hypothetical protein
MRACSKIFYPHYCYDCQMQYFGVEQNAAKPCPRCGGANVINGPLMCSQKYSVACKDKQTAAGSVAGGK